MYYGRWSDCKESLCEGLCGTVQYEKLTPRGLSKKDENALQALYIFLEDYGVVDVEVEPLVKGFRLMASNNMTKPKYSSWGLSITDAVENMVRSVVNGN